MMRFCNDNLHTIAAFGFMLIAVEYKIPNTIESMLGQTSKSYGLIVSDNVSS